MIEAISNRHRGRPRGLRTQFGMGMILTLGWHVHEPNLQSPVFM